MEITGSYTGEVDLDGPEPVADSLIDTHSLSVSQALLPPAGLSASALALSERRDQLRLARLRLWRARNAVALEVARTFLTLTGREVALALAEQRLAFAERDLAHTRSRVEQQAASRLDLLDATIAVAEQRNALAGQRAVLTLDLAEFFADLDLSPGPLTVPEADLDALRRNARALLAEPAPPGAIGTALEYWRRQPRWPAPNCGPSARKPVCYRNSRSASTIASRARHRAPVRSACRSPAVTPCTTAAAGRWRANRRRSRRLPPGAI